jgi:integrase
MILTVFRPKRIKNGKVQIARSYRGRYRLDGERKITDIPLHTTDRRVAQQRIEQIVKEKQMEAVGLLAPHAVRVASQTRLERHLSDYVADLQAVGRDGQYIYELGNRVRRLMRECGWSQMKDVTSDSFQVWRAKQSLAPKTVNEYLTSITSLLNWMEKHERIERSPLRHVEKVQTNGKQARPRRAFARDEIPRLLAAAGPRKVIYLTAVHTGLRRKELKLMETDELHLDAEQPFVNVRPSTTKNHKQAVIALHPDVVAELRKLPLLPGKVFANGLPKMETFKRDLRRAGIEFIDAKGRRADFHSLRHTLGTNLALAGTAQRAAPEDTRHSDIRLTTKTYTDTGLLPVSDAVAKLPSFLGSPKKDSQIDSQTLFREGQALSIPVINSTNVSKRKAHEDQELTGVVSGRVTTAQDSEKSCAIQGSNL